MRWRWFGVIARFMGWKTIHKNSSYHWSFAYLVAHGLFSLEISENVVFRAVFLYNSPHMNKPENTEELKEVETGTRSPSWIRWKTDSNQIEPSPILRAEKAEKGKKNSSSGRNIGKNATWSGNFLEQYAVDGSYWYFVTALFFPMQPKIKVKPEELTITDVVSQVKAGEVKLLSYRVRCWKFHTMTILRHLVKPSGEVDASVTLGHLLIWVWLGRSCP